MTKEKVKLPTNIFKALNSAIMNFEYAQIVAYTYNKSWIGEYDILNQADPQEIMEAVVNGYYQKKSEDELREEKIDSLYSNPPENLHKGSYRQGILDALDAFNVVYEFLKFYKRG